MFLGSKTDKSVDLAGFVIIVLHFNGWQDLFKWPVALLMFIFFILVAQGLIIVLQWVFDFSAQVVDSRSGAGVYGNNHAALSFCYFDLWVDMPLMPVVVARKQESFYLNRTCIGIIFGKNQLIFIFFFANLHFPLRDTIFPEIKFQILCKET